MCQPTTVYSLYFYQLKLINVVISVFSTLSSFTLEMQGLGARLFTCRWLVRYVKVTVARYDRDKTSKKIKVLFNGYLNFLVDVTHSFTVCLKNKEDTRESL